ncbi:MAG TPA: M23 family peptidase [Treponema sp.]|nr:M23 family peptidase [Treponema sp.]
MEIISYVGFENEPHTIIRNFRTKLTASRNARNHEKARDSSLVYHFAGGENARSFAAAAVRPQLSLRSVLCSLGRALDAVCSHAWIAAAALLFVSASYGAKLLYTYAAGHTGPLVLKDSGRTELETLDKVMSSFAISGTQDYNDSGDILDGNGNASVIAESLFKKAVTFKTYKVLSGDTISGITRKFGLTNLSTLIAVNDIDNARALYAGQKLRIPSVDGLIYTVKPGNSLAGLSAKYNIPLEDLLDVNDLSSQTLKVGQQLFIPGAKLDSSKLHEALGDMFKKPIAAAYRLTSPYGWREDPFTGVRSFHTGIDMACPQGTPIYASMGGKVLTAGWTNIFGNYVIISHPNGYQTLYGHMSKVIAKKGQIVNQGTCIGLVGTTGYSTGPHLHFTVYKNGRLVDPRTVLK